MLPSDARGVTDIGQVRILSLGTEFDILAEILLESFFSFGTNHE